MANAEDLIRIGPPTSGVQPAGQDVRAAHRRRAVHGPLPLMHMVVYTDEPSRACRAPNWPGPVGGRAVPAPETGQPCVARLGSEAMGAEEPDVAPAGEAVTRILGAAVRGEPRAAEDLLPLVYDELRRLAAAYMAREAPGQTLNGTALVHGPICGWSESTPRKTGTAAATFLPPTAEAMRRILIDAARRKRTARHGGGLLRRPLDEDRDGLAAPEPDEHLLALDEALLRLAAADPTKAQLVRLRVYAGLGQGWSHRRLGLSRSSLPDTGPTPVPGSMTPSRVINCLATGPIEESRGVKRSTLAAGHPLASHNRHKAIREFSGTTLRARRTVFSHI